MQPWRVYAISGRRIDELKALMAPRMATELPKGEGTDYTIYPEPLTEPYRSRRFTVGELRHYVLPNPDVDRFEIATVHVPVQQSLENGDLSAKPMDAANAAAETANLQLGSRNAKTPEKTAAVFIARYLQHPIYRYRCDVIHRGGRAIGLLATRIATHNSRTALRIIDYLGPDDAVPGLGRLVLEQVRTAGAEYADVYNWGIDPDLFARAGFSQVDPDGRDVVPDYFEPFEARNVRLRFAIKSDRPVVLFKGDGDQDRPSQLS
jgi:hypothetical protein